MTEAASTYALKAEAHGPKAIRLFLMSRLPLESQLVGDCELMNRVGFGCKVNLGCLDNDPVRKRVLHVGRDVLQA